jgi:geranylgeranyl transferase type-1 subunit beta
MLLAFFIVSALDLLGLLDPDPATGKAKITEEERQGWVDWIYHCQHPGGGFRGFTGTIVDGEGESVWDVANLPATFFALCTLVVLGDDLGRVDREKCLRWTARLQRGDGSFGEVLVGEGGVGGYGIEGGRDLRFCCCAAGIWYMLRDGRADDATVMFDEVAMVRYIQSCQSYEGGFSEGPYREAHSGLNYCAVGALSFLSKSSTREHGSTKVGMLQETYGKEIDLEACIKWMLLRQTTYIEDDQDEDSEDDEQTHTKHTFSPQTKTTHDRSSSTAPPELLNAGFNGRTNKIADTCYSFWNLGALAILGKQHLIDQYHLQHYLLTKVQHPIGGFGKGVGDPPDILHAYLGLATLSLLGKDGVKPVDPTLCISTEAVGRIGRLRWKSGVDEER